MDLHGLRNYSFASGGFGVFPHDMYCRCEPRASRAVACFEKDPFGTPQSRVPKICLALKFSAFTVCGSRFSECYRDAAEKVLSSFQKPLLCFICVERLVLIYLLMEMLC